MRLALLSWEARHAVLVGGVGVHVSDLAAALTRQGHEVHVFTRLGEGQRLYDNIFGVHMHRCPFDPRPDFVDEMAESMGPSLVHYVHEVEAQSGSFDWIHCHDWLPLPAALRLTGEGAAPLAMTFHTTEWGRSGAWPESGNALRIAELERAAVETADTVIAVSHEIRRQLESLYQSPDWKTAVVYHGIDLKPFDQSPADPGQVKQSLGLDPMAPTALFVGRLTFRKGPDLLLQAVPEVLAQVPNAQFLFVGEGDMREHLERERERFGVAQAVHFLGWRQAKELIDLYHACDLVCTPSRSDPFGVVSLSAWAASKPVVALRVGSAGEFLLHETNGLLVESTPQAVAAGLLQLFADFDHLRWLGRNGRVAAETAFTWDTIAQETCKAYQRRDTVRSQTAS